MAEIALRALQSAREAPTAPDHSQWGRGGRRGGGQCHSPKGVRAGRGTRRRSARHTRSTVIHLSSASITRARRRKRLDRVATFVEVLKVVLVFSGRMQKAAVWAFGDLARAPRGTARIPTLHGVCPPRSCPPSAATYTYRRVRGRLGRPPQSCDPDKGVVATS